MRSLLLGAVALLASAAIVFAHDPGLSSATIVIDRESIDALVTFNPRDLETLRVKANELAPELLRLSGTEAPLRLAGQKTEVDSAQNIAFRLRFKMQGRGGPLHIESGILDRLPFGHRQMLDVRTPRGDILAQRLISARENGLEVDLARAERSPPAVSGRFAEFFILGIQHILTGYDHLLFLAGILIVCASFGASARIITCFTIAHSITLALATFNLVAIPSRIVEPMIAASIVYVGVENVWRGRNLHWREGLTFAFGLVHGLGFASVLREMGIGINAAGVAVPLFSFNFGVETGQLLVAACFLPLVLKLKRAGQLPSWTVPAMSCVIACAGACWFLERIMA